MEVTQRICLGLENFPEREIWYFGPKIVPCSEKSVISHQNYTFECFQYDIKDNGSLYIKMFDPEGKQLLTNLTIVLSYNFTPGFAIEFFNDYSPKSDRHFQFSAATYMDIESFLTRLILIVERVKKYSKEILNYQIIYAYIIFLFYQSEFEEIKASKFSEKYNYLRKMRALISGELVDFQQSKSFSKDTIFYKVFDRFINKQMEILKSKPIWYD